jgi:hypothetical protein
MLVVGERAPVIMCELFITNSANARIFRCNWTHQRIYLFIYLIIYFFALNIISLQYRSNYLQTRQFSDAIGPTNVFIYLFIYFFALNIISLQYRSIYFRLSDHRSLNHFVLEGLARFLLHCSKDLEYQNSFYSRRHFYHVTPK